MIFFSEDVVVAHQIPNFFKRFTFLDMYVKEFGDSKMFSKLWDLIKTMKLSERACCWSSAGEVSKLCQLRFQSEDPVMTPLSSSFPT